MLQENNVKEQLSIAYVKAVASICKFGSEITQMDFDSIDVSITCNGLLDTASIIRSPELKLQLKATSTLALDANNNYPFPLPIKNYDDLRANTLTPRLLVLLRLSDLSSDWLTHSIDNLLIRKCAFWLNLKNKPTVSNTTNVKVDIPNINVFSPATLTDLMLKISKGESI